MKTGRERPVKMAKKRQTRNRNETITLLGDLVGVIDDTVEQFTGKRIAGWFQELKQQEETPVGNTNAPSVPTPQSSDDPYSVLGLPSNASKSQVKDRYRQLANIFHPDRENGYSPAMTRINQAYEKIMRERQ